MRYLLLLTLLTSCSTVYLTRTRNAPLFREQGEAQLTGYLSSAGAEAQAAYALTDHVAMIGGFSYASKKVSNPDYDYKNIYGEAGIGYYNRTRSVRWEIIAGYGMGEGTSNAVYYFFAPAFGQGVSTIATGKMRAIFLQPTIGTNNRGTNLSFTPRLSWVDFTEFNSVGVTVKPDEKASILLEPAATLKFRIKGNLFGMVQLGLTVPINGEPFFKYQALQASIGVQIDTGGLNTKVY